MSTIVIVLAAVFFLGMGSFALAGPAALIRPFGITLPSPESRAEVRAVYGGFGLAIAGMLALALTGHPARDGILITVCLLYTSPSPRDGATTRMPSSA